MTGTLIGRYVDNSDGYSNFVAVGHPFGAPSVIEKFGPDPETSAEQKRLTVLFARVLEQLSLELRAVFVLYELEEFTMAEIAATLGLPPGTVASRLRRGRETFERLAALAVAEGELP